MILYQLVCAKGHEFESWFRDSAAYDAQAAQGFITCPVCQSTKVCKAVMAPNVARAGRGRDAGQMPTSQVQARQTTPFLDERHAGLRAIIRDLRETLISSTEDVGDKFPEEARRMHDGETEARAIRGRASLEEAKALLDEGIEIAPIPGLPGDGN